jgi:hypothetical protein
MDGPDGAAKPARVSQPSKPGDKVWSSTHVFKKRDDLPTLPSATPLWIQGELKEKTEDGKAWKVSYEAAGGAECVMSKQQFRHQAPTPKAKSPRAHVAPAGKDAPRSQAQGEMYVPERIVGKQGSEFVIHWKGLDDPKEYSLEPGEPRAHTHHSIATVLPQA